jgi:hypothetical protein
VAYIYVLAAILPEASKNMEEIKKTLPFHYVAFSSESSIYKKK